MLLQKHYEIPHDAWDRLPANSDAATDTPA
jgi:hypothetical protein